MHIYRLQIYEIVFRGSQKFQNENILFPNKLNVQIQIKYWTYGTLLNSKIVYTLLVYKFRGVTEITNGLYEYELWCEKITAES